MDAQRHTAMIFVTQDVGCASYMCDWGITSIRVSLLAIVAQRRVHRRLLRLLAREMSGIELTMSPAFGHRPSTVN